MPKQHPRPNPSCAEPLQFELLYRGLRWNCQTRRSGSFHHNRRSSGGNHRVGCPPVVKTEGGSSRASHDLAGRWEIKQVEEIPSLGSWLTLSDDGSPCQMSGDWIFRASLKKPLTSLMFKIGLRYLPKRKHLIVCIPKKFLAIELLKPAFFERGGPHNQPPCPSLHHPRNIYIYIQYIYCTTFQ